MNIWKQFWQEEDGIGVVEIILILVILVALIVIFKEQISNIIQNAFSEINNSAGTVNEEITIDNGV